MSASGHGRAASPSSPTGEAKVDSVPYDRHRHNTPGSHGHHHHKRLHSKILRRAAESRLRLSTLQRAVAQGFQVDAVDSQGCTTLMHCCRHAQVQLVQELVNQGADVLKMDREARFCLDYLFLHNVVPAEESRQYSPADDVQLEARLVLLKWLLGTSLRLRMYAAQLPWLKELLRGAALQHHAAAAAALQFLRDSQPEPYPLLEPEDSNSTDNDRDWGARLRSAWAADIDEEAFGADDPFYAEFGGDEGLYGSHSGSRRVDTMTEEEYREYMWRGAARRLQEQGGAFGPQRPTAADRSARAASASAAAAAAAAAQRSAKILHQQREIDEQRRQEALQARMESYARRCEEFFSRLSRLVAQGRVATSDGAKIPGPSTEPARKLLQFADVPFPTGSDAEIEVLLMGETKEAPEEPARQRGKLIVPQPVAAREPSSTEAVEARRRRLRQAQLRWHPDRWSRYWPYFRAADVEKIQQEVQATSQRLNRLMADHDSELRHKD